MNMITNLLDKTVRYNDDWYKVVAVFLEEREGYRPAVIALGVRMKDRTFCKLDLNDCELAEKDLNPSGTAI